MFHALFVHFRPREIAHGSRIMNDSRRRRDHEEQSPIQPSMNDTDVFCEKVGYQRCQDVYLSYVDRFHGMIWNTGVVCRELNTHSLAWCCSTVAGMLIHYEASSTLY